MQSTCHLWQRKSEDESKRNVQRKAEDDSHGDSQNKQWNCIIPQYSFAFLAWKLFWCNLQKNFMQFRQHIPKQIADTSLPSFLPHREFNLHFRATFYRIHGGTSENIKRKTKECGKFIKTQFLSDFHRIEWHAWHRCIFYYSSNICSHPQKDKL